MTGLLGIVLAGCGQLVPATTPPQLAFTPGPAAVVTDQVYKTPVFTVRYPTDWRVVTGAADQPGSVVFVGPDERSTIRLQVGELGSFQFDTKFKSDVRGVTLSNGTLITAVGQTLPDKWDNFAPIFEAVVATITATEG